MDFPGVTLNPIWTQAGCLLLKAIIFLKYVSSLESNGLMWLPVHYASLFPHQNGSVQQQNDYYFFFFPPNMQSHCRSHSPQAWALARCSGSGGNLGPTALRTSALMPPSQCGSGGLCGLGWWAQARTAACQAQKETRQPNHLGDTKRH